MTHDNVTPLDAGDAPAETPEQTAFRRVVRALDRIEPDLAQALVGDARDATLDGQLIADVRSICELIHVATFETEDRGNELDAMSLGSLANAASLAARLCSAALDEGDDPRWFREFETEEGSDRS